MVRNRASRLQAPRKLPALRKQVRRESVLRVFLGLMLLLVSLASLAQAQSAANAPPENAVENTAAEPTEIRLFSLLQEGGWFLAPLGLMSLLVVTFTIERAVNLRRSRVIPRGLVRELEIACQQPSGFDPRGAYKLCQRFPSAASNVITAMLLKIGRPHSEVEHAVSEASQREAERLYANVRWLTLAAAVSPLLGLLGTVWGLIVAFFDSTQLAPGQNKAEVLGHGIYAALITTLCGLVIAIPAAIIAHFFEGRIQTLFHQVDELLFSLFPHIERFEGRQRLSLRLGNKDVELRPTDANGREPAPETGPRQASPKKKTKVKQ